MNYYKDLKITENDLENDPDDIKIDDEDDIQCADRLLYKSFDDLPASFRNKMIVKMNKINKIYYNALFKRFKDNRKSMIYWKCARYLDPSCQVIPGDINDAFGKIRFGPNKYSNNESKLALFTRE